jgi:hypothetical protein
MSYGQDRMPCRRTEEFLMLHESRAAIASSYNLVVGTLLAVAGGVACLVKAWLLYFEELSWPGGSRPAVGAGIYVVLGVVGIVAAWAARLHSGRAAQVLALAGLVAIVFALSATLVPRIIPGLLLLGAATMIFAHRRTVDPRQAASELDQWSVAVGLVAHAVVGVLFAAVGLGAPPWAVLAVYVIWASTLALALRLRHTHPRLVVAMPVVAFAAMFALVSLGPKLFGWTT